MIASMVSGCSTPAVPTVGDDEMVGRPAEVAHTTDSPPPRHGALWYRIEPGDDAINIRMRLLNPPPRATFFLPGLWAGSDFDDLVRVNYARGPDRFLPMTLDRDEGRIDIDTDAVDWLDISYEIDTLSQRDEEHRFFPWMKEHSFFAYAPTILILPSAGIAQQLRDIPIEVHVPAQWAVTATWPIHQAPTTGPGTFSVGYVADDIRSLRDAFIAGSRDWERLSVPLPQGELTVTFADQFELDSEQFVEAAATITAAYLQAFESYRKISAVIMDLPADAPQTLRGTGRRGGFVLEVPRSQPLDAELLLLLAHEAFHMWNGHHVVPDSDTSDNVQWFKEGMTHYIAIKTLARLGLIDGRAVRRELALAGQYYLHNPIIAGGDVRTIDHTRLPYDRGVLIGLALDLALLRHTDGQRSVEDWFALLLSPQFAEDARAYDLDTLENSFRILTDGFDPELTRLYRQLVHSDETIDVEALFYSFGLHYLETGRERRARLLPIDEQATSFEILFDISAHNRR